MYCNNCGAPVPDGSTICPSCSAILNNQQHNTDGTYYTPPSSSGGYYNQQNFNRQGTYQQSYTQEANRAQDNYFNQSGYDNSEKLYEDELKNAKLFGILSLVIGLLFSRIVGIVLGAIGISKAKEVPDLPQNPLLSKMKRDSIRFNKLGIILPIVLWAVFVVIYILFIAVFMARTASFLS